MSQDLLQSLMQLFAILAKLDGSTGASRETVKSFLKEHLGVGDDARWLLQFDDYLATAKARPSRNDVRLSVRDSSRLILICTQINGELTQRQKIMVLFMLFSFITRPNSSLEPEEFEFLISVADVFNISHKEFHQVERFALGRQPIEEDVEEMVYISSLEGAPNTRSKHIYNEELIDNAQVTILRMAAIGMYLVRYEGVRSLYLNGSAMQSRRIYSLDTGSSIWAGHRQVPIYYSDIVSKYTEDEKSDHLTFEARDITYHFSNGKIGLHNINLAEESGRLLGLMGPSGAGKSTLLEVLNGNLRPTQGQVLINGKDLYDNKGLFKGIIGYVPQDDLLIEELTVFQNLFYAAKLCFGNYTQAKLNTLVGKTLLNLGLSHIRDLKVGSPMDKSISGGERKRVNIGLELLRAPQVLFIDEPTSGLSSRDSVNVMELLKELSEQGKLVFVVIHQPSSDIYKMFDRLIILDTGGYPIYYGNPVEALRYFKARINQVGRDLPLCHECGHVNPEEIFDIVETRQVNEYGQYTNQRRYAPTWWNEQFLLHLGIPSLPARATATLVEYKKAPIIRQLFTFMTRDILSKLNNKQYLAINMLEAPALAILLAYVFKYFKTDELTTSTYIFQENDNIPVYLFISIIVALFLGLTVSAEEIFKDRRILKREAFLHLSKNAYITSKMTILFAISAMQCLMFTWIGNYILDIRALDGPMWAVLFTVSCFANMLGLNISSAFNSAITIYILIPILLIPQLVLGGLVIKFDQINPAIRNGDAVPMYGEIMASRWAFEALMVTQFKDNPHQKPLYRYDQVLALSDYRKTYLLPVLESKIEYCDHHNGTRDVATIRQIDKELRILSYQLSEEQRITGLNMHLPAKMDYKHYTSELSRALRIDITSLRTHYDKVFNKTYKAKDTYVTSQITPGAKAVRYVAQAQAYTNNSVADVVKNSQSQVKIVQEGDRLIQKAFPIYLEPEGREGFFNFRTHFYAPVKHFIGQRIPTLWFNLAMIWMMCALLYITLYYNSLARFLRLFTGK